MLELLENVGERLRRNEIKIKIKIKMLMRMLMRMIL